MKKIDIVILYLALGVMLFAQPGKSRGPGGQYTDRMEMMRVWKMTEYLELNKRHSVLEIGTGSGYQAAILACLVRRVYTIERLRPLLVQAEARCKQLQLSNIIYRHADGKKGWPEAAPFDRIIITCQTEKVPAFLLDQLKVGGILVAPVGPSGQEELFRVKRKENGIETQCLMPARFVPMVDGTER